MAAVQEERREGARGEARQQRRRREAAIQLQTVNHTTPHQPPHQWNGGVLLLYTKGEEQIKSINYLLYAYSEVGGFSHVDYIGRLDSISKWLFLHCLWDFFFYIPEFHISFINNLPSTASSFTTEYFAIIELLNAISSPPFLQENFLLLQIYCLVFKFIVLTCSNLILPSLFQNQIPSKQAFGRRFRYSVPMGPRSFGDL